MNPGGQADLHIQAGVRKPSTAPIHCGSVTAVQAVVNRSGQIGPADQLSSIPGQRSTRATASAPAIAKSTSIKKAVSATAAPVSTRTKNQSATSAPAQSRHAHSVSVADSLQPPQPVRRFLKPKSERQEASASKLTMETIREDSTGTALSATAAPFMPAASQSNSASRWSAAPVMAFPSHRVKPLKLPMFSGLEKDFLRWRQHFRRIVDDDPHTTEVYKLAQLRQCLCRVRRQCEQ